MIIAFANNQTMAAASAGSTNEIFTDPVPMNDNNQATVIPNVHYLFAAGGGAGTLWYYGQMSNDGTTWVDAALSDSATAAGVMTPKTALVNAAFIRFRFTFAQSAGGTTAGVAFDLHVRLDHA